VKISVYIPSYNQKKYLVEAIESVLNQTLPPHQLIIVDDCSTDDSQDLISDYASRYPDLITPVYHRRNMGVARTRIDALRRVTGDYVTYVDGDDKFLPTKLEKESALLKETGFSCRIAFSNHYINFDGERKPMWSDSDVLPQGDVFRQTFAREYPRDNLFKMELTDYREWKKIGFHDPKLDVYEDWEVRIRLSKHLKTVYCPEPLAEVRRGKHHAGLSTLDSSIKYDAVNYIHEKNKGLLEDLSPEQIRRVEKRLNYLKSRFAYQAAIEKLQRGNTPGALGYYLKSIRHKPSGFNFKFTAKFFLTVIGIYKPKHNEPERQCSTNTRANG